MSTLTDFIIVCPLSFLAGFVDAVAGGGGLISLPAYMIAGLPAHFAIGTNKLSSAMGTALAVGKFSRQGHILWKTALAASAAALVASNLGAHLTLLIDDGSLKKLLLVILPLTALYLSRCKSLEIEKEPYSERKTILICVAVASIIGVYDGFYGPGTGTFLILLLTGAAHMNVLNANGVSKVINLTTNLSALIVLLVNGKVLVTLGLTAGLFCIAGNFTGIRFLESKGVKIVKPLIFTVLTIFFVKVIAEMI